MTAKEEVIACFERSNLTKLVESLIEDGLVDSGQIRSFESNVPQIRYLLLQVTKQVKCNPNVSTKYFEAFALHGVCGCVLKAVYHGDVHSLLWPEDSHLSRSSYDKESPNAEESPTASTLPDAKHPQEQHTPTLVFSEEHTTLLTEILAKHSNKFKEIGISLSLPRNTLDGISALMVTDGQVVCLDKVLSHWVGGQHKHAIPRTLDSLKRALASNIVNLGDVAARLEENLAQHGICAKQIQVTENHGVLNQEGMSLSSKASENGKELCPVAADFDKQEVDLSWFKKTLVNMYLVKPEVPREDSWRPVSNHAFINLALINQGKTSNASKFFHSTIQGDMDDIIKDKENIRFEDIFQDFQGNSLVLVEGRPGGGKTTLVHKLSQDWASGKNILREARLVFLISLRVLATKERVTLEMKESTAKEKWLKNILELFYHDQSGLLKHINSSKGEGVCFILDGLDEYSLDHITSKLIRKEYLPLSMVIVASRPIATAKFRNQANKQVEVVGFTREQIFKYISKYKFNNQFADGLKAYLDQHRNVLHLCYIPLHTAMVCSLYDEMGEGLPSTETKIYEHFTQRTLLRKLLHENAKYRLTIINAIMDGDCFQKICKLAYDMTVECRQVMYQDELPLFDSDEPSLGLVTMDLSTKMYGCKYCYTFLHLTFQEYLAAWHISKLSYNEQMKVINELCDKKFMRIVWKFYCGLTKFDKILCNFNKIINPHDDLFKIQCAFESQQSITCGSLLENQCEECLSFNNHFMTTKDFTALGYVIKNLLVRKLVLNNCKFGEDDVIALQKEAGKNLSSIKCLHLNCGICVGEHFKSAGALLNSLTSLEEINLVGTKFTPSTPEPSIKFNLPNLETMVLDESQCEVKFLKVLRYLFGQDFKCINILRFPVTCLRNNILEVFGLEILIHSVSQFQHVLGLQGLKLDHKNIEILSADLETSLCTKLILTNCSIDDIGAKALAGGIKYTTKLKTLNLSINRIGDEGAIALAENITCCTDLSMLDLSCNDISDDGAKAIFDAVIYFEKIDLHIWNSKISESAITSLQSIRSNVDIRTLELEVTASINGYNLIEEVAKTPAVLCCCKNLKVIAYSSNTQAILECLQNCKYGLQTLELLVSPYSFIESKLFVDSLKYCENLIHLNLEGIQLNDDGVYTFGESLKVLKLQTLTLSGGLFLKDLRSLAEAFACCGQLKSLNLAYNQIGDDDVKTLAVAVQNCANLHTFDLSGNDISVGGAESLASVLIHCKSLQSLDLADNFIGSNGIKALANTLLNLHTTCNLTTLNVSENDIYNGAKALTTLLKKWGNCLQALYLGTNLIGQSEIIILNEVLREFSELQTLDLSENIINDDGAKSLVNGLMHCTNLQTLNLSRNCISANGIKALADGLQYWSRLQTFDLGGNCMGNACAEALADGLKNCFALETLRLHDNCISADGVAALVCGLKNCIKLQVLDVSDNDIRARGAIDLVYGLKDCSNLKLLNLRNNFISDEGAVAFHDNLKHYKKLTTLDLGSNAIKVDGAKALIEGLRHTSNLLKLNLSNNSIGDKGVNALAESLKHISKLQNLNLGNNDITDDGAVILAEGLKYISGLQKFCLASNGIEDNGALALADGLKHCSNLQELDLDGNLITGHGAQALAVAVHCSSPHTLDLSSNSTGCAWRQCTLVSNLECSNILKLSLRNNYYISEFYAYLEHCKYLEELDLGYALININNVDFVDLLKCYCKLQILDLDGNYFQDANFFADYLRHCSAHLSELNLCSTGIDAEVTNTLSGGLMKCSNLSVLLLDDNNVGDDGAEALANSLNCCSNLQELHLACNQISSKGAKALVENLKCCRNLQVLNLGDNEIGSSTLTFEDLKHYSSLQEFDLSGNRIVADSARALADSLKHCDNLLKLDLTSNRIGDLGVKALADGLKHCCKMEELSFYGNKISAVGATSLSADLKCFINMKIFEFGGNGIGADGAKVLASSLKHCIKLHTLDLSQNGVSCDGVRALADSLMYCINLQYLYLGYNSIGSDGAQALALCLKHHCKLRTLNLGHNIIGADGAKALSDGIKHCSYLQTLNLGHNVIDSDGVKALSDGIRHCNYLKVLQLGDNNISDDGARALADALKHCKYLYKLVLSDNAISDDGARMLAGGLINCSNLQRLDIFGNYISDDGKRDLTDLPIKTLKLLKINKRSRESSGSDDSSD